MKYNQLGRTGLFVSELCLGTMTFGKDAELDAQMFAMAQDAEIKFWLKGAPNNIQGCIAADPSFTREQTFLLASTTKVVTSLAALAAVGAAACTCS